MTGNDAFTLHLRLRKSNKAHVWPLAPPTLATVGGAGDSAARHAASVRSRTIMKKQPSAGAAADADLSYVQRAFLPGLTGSSTDRWLKATPHLFLSLNGEENGRSHTAALLWLLCSCQFGAEGRRDWSSDWQVLRTCCLLPVRDPADTTAPLWCFLTLWLYS